MLQCRKPILAIIVLAVALTGCLEDGNEGKNAGSVGPISVSGERETRGASFPLYNPIQTEFPLPEDAVFFANLANDGTALNGTDPGNPVTQGLGFIDGTSLLAPFDIKINASLDPDQTLDARPFISVETDDEGRVLFPIEEVPGGEVVPNPNQNVFLLPLDIAGGDSLFIANGEIPGLALASDFRRARMLEQQGMVGEADAIFDRLLQSPPVRLELIDVDGGSNNAIRILPEAPLAAKTKYAVALSNDIRDASGNRLVGAPIYRSASDPSRQVANPQLDPFKQSATASRQQVTDFNRFKGDFFSSREIPQSVSVPGFRDIVYSGNFTTTALDDVLLANAAPLSFYDNRLRVETRQAEIERLVEGFYNLSAAALTEGANASEAAINQGIFDRLTDETFRFFDPALAERVMAANEAGNALRFSQITRDSNGNIDRFAAIAAQAATADAAEEVMENDIIDQAMDMAERAEEFLDTPKPRPVQFFSRRDGSEINEALGQTGDAPVIGDLPGLGDLLNGIVGDSGALDVDVRVFEGVITLPYYMGVPEDSLDGLAIQRRTWLTEGFEDSAELPLPLSERITYRSPFARKTADVTVPIVVTMPDESAPLGVISEPDGGYPVIIYQTALTQDRSAALPLAVASGLLCAAEDSIDDCFVVVTIDQPLHGVFEGREGAVGLQSINEQPNVGSLDLSNIPAPMERHFGFAANENMTAVPASTLAMPESGGLFLNFTNFANTLGNMRQSTMDSLNLNASLNNIIDAIANCSPGCGTSFNINTDRVYYLTHSLSGMGGVQVPQITNLARMAGNESLNEIQGQAFLNTGGHFTRILENSPELAPQLLPGLEAASEGLLVQGRTELNLFLNILQSLVDNVDPANYAARYEGTTTMMTAVVGNPMAEDPLAGCFPPVGEMPAEDRVTSDCTIPNAADDTLFVQGPLMRDVMQGDSGTVLSINSRRAPLAGTEPLARLMGANNVLTSTDRPFITLFSEGSHGNPISSGQSDIDPGSSEDVFFVTAIQMLETFLGEAPSTTFGNGEERVLVDDADRMMNDQ